MGVHPRCCMMLSTPVFGPGAVNASESSDIALMCSQKLKKNALNTVSVVVGAGWEWGGSLVL